MTPERVREILSTGADRRLLVLGDLMLDEFIWGKVSRISPEAPVPVVEVNSESLYPGGAANVARNLREFVTRVGVVGTVGDDMAGRRLGELLREQGIGIDGVVERDDVPTTVKTRIIARTQQVVRVDRERKSALSPRQRAEVLRRLEAALPQVDALIVEDYGKGLLTQDFVQVVFSMAQAAGCVVTVDPNPHNPLCWDGATAVKPNRTEAFAAVGRPLGAPSAEPLSDELLLETGWELMKRWNTEQLLVTLSEQGMLLFLRDGTLHHTPTRAREVYDVSGAGDTAIALYTLALAAGATAVEASEIANHASGVVVGKLGTATLTPDELLESFENHGA